MLMRTIGTKALVGLVVVAIGGVTAGVLSAEHPSIARSSSAYSALAPAHHQSSPKVVTPQVQKVREGCTAACKATLSTPTSGGGTTDSGASPGVSGGGTGGLPGPGFSSSVIASPNSGTAGTVVTLTGAGFAPSFLQRGTILVRFSNGSNPSAGSATVAPSGALTGAISVTSGDAQGSNPIDVIENYACGIVICHTGAVASFSVTAPVLYTYTGQVGSWYQIPLQKVPNESVEGLPDATKVGTLVFTTNDPYYQALNGTTLNVWRASNEFPGELIVHNGNQGPQPVYGTWVYSPFYAVTWQGAWTQMRLTTNVSVENFSDAQLEGQGTNFETDDPYYSALDGNTINVWMASAEFGNVLVAHNGDQGPQPVYGTWLLP